MLSLRVCDKELHSMAYVYSKDWGVLEKASGWPNWGPSK